MVTETLNIPLDEETRAFVEEQAVKRGCESVAAYVAALVEADYKRWARENLEKLLLEGIESGPASPMTRQDWDDLRRRVEQQVEREHTAGNKAKTPAGAGV
jgi:antitoxin ParD1/3/4